jgi:hypothetical protein
MSQENVEIWRASIERQLADFEAGIDPEATVAEMAEIWDPEIELDATESGVLDLNSIFRGADAVRDFWHGWFSAWETVHYDYELVDAGDSVVMLLELVMRGRSTGIEMPFGKFAWVSRFKDGLVVHVKLYMSQAEALEAAGLSE